MRPIDILNGLQKMLQISITEILWEMGLLKLPPHLLGGNELQDNGISNQIETQCDLM